MKTRERERENGREEGIEPATLLYCDVGDVCRWAGGASVRRGAPLRDSNPG